MAIFKNMELFKKLKTYPLPKIEVKVKMNKENYSILLQIEKDTLLTLGEFTSETYINPAIKSLGVPELRRYLKSIRVRKSEFNKWFDSNGYSIPKAKNYLKGKFDNACKKRGLVKGVTIPPDDLYEIGMEICPSRMPPRANFKDGENMYHILRQYASDKKFKKKMQNK